MKKPVLFVLATLILSVGKAQKGAEYVLEEFWGIRSKTLTPTYPSIDRIILLYKPDWLTVKCISCSVSKVNYERSYGEWSISERNDENFTFEYDDKGRLIKNFWRGQTNTFEYYPDSIVCRSDSKVIRTLYLDSLNRPTLWRDDYGQLSFSYNRKGMLTNSVEMNENGSINRTDYAYDKNGFLNGIKTYSDGRLNGKVEYATAILESGYKVVEYSYTESGFKEKNKEYIFDKKWNPLKINFFEYSDEKVSSYIKFYYTNSKISKIAENWMGIPEGEKSDIFKYDQKGRLVEILYKDWIFGKDILTYSD